MALSNSMREIPWFNEGTRALVFNNMLPTMKQDDKGRYIFETETGAVLLALDYMDKYATENPQLLKAEGRRGSGATNGNAKGWQQTDINPSDITAETLRDPAKAAAIRAQIQAAMPVR
jgi:hypothetical protein